MKLNLSYTIVIGLIGLFSCKKETSTTPPVAVDTIAIKPAVDPPIAPTIGFFLDDWQAKSFTVPSYKDTAIPATAPYTVTIDASTVITKIPPAIAGNNANLWMTQIITEPTLVQDITNLHPQIIRFPGGSISDVFFWNAPNHTPPADAPVQLVNANGTKSNSGFWFGKNEESWTFSVDNYYKLLQQSGSKGLITVNYGYARYGTSNDPVAAAAHLAADWVRYDKGRTRYWEVGNENFGDWEAGYRIDLSQNKDNQPEYLTGELYGKHFKVFADSMRKAASEVGATIEIGAVMVEAAAQSWETPTRKTWNAGLMANAGNVPDYYVVHNYYTAYQTNSNAADIVASAPTETKKVMDYVTQTLQNGGVTIKPIALDEWNINAEGSMQKVSHINGMHAVLVVGEALKNKYGLTARWDLANGWDNGNDHGMFSNGDEPGVPRWTPRPAFYHLYYFQKFLGDRFIASSITNNPNIVTYASSFTSGQVGVTLVNEGSTPQTIKIDVQNFSKGNRFYWYTVTGGNDNGEFSRKTIINGVGPDGIAGGPANYASLPAYSAMANNGIRITVPAWAVVYMVIDKK